MEHPELSNDKPVISVEALVISYQDHHLACLQMVFRSCGWKIHSVPDLTAGIGLIRRLDPLVVICDDQLKDGDWRLALQAVMKAGFPPLLIVASRIADEHMWAEILSLGAYDLLAKPYDASEVIHAVGSAWEHANWERTKPSLSAARRPSPASPTMNAAGLVWSDEKSSLDLELR